MSSEPQDRERFALGLVQELARALVAHRLYPDDPQQAGFVAAVERVREAALPAIAGGALRFDIRSRTFHLGAAPLAGGEQVDRLALECFERRVEELEVRSLPDTLDVFHLCRILSLPPSEVAEAGGAPALLLASGVTSISLGEVRLDPADHEALLASLEPELADLWSSLGDPERLATNLLVAGLHANPAQAAQELFRRFGDLHDAVPDDLVGRTGALRRMHEVVDLLPDGVRREFFATVVTRMSDETFATNYVNDLTDHDLVTQLVRLGAAGEGPELAELATEVLEQTGRPPTVIPMLAERLRIAAGNGSAEPDASTGAPSLALIGAGEDGSAIRTAVADAIAERLVDEASEDLRQIRELYPGADDDLRVIARLAFRDYLVNERDADRLERALAGWVARVRQALHAADREAVIELLAVVDLDGEAPAAGPIVERAKEAAVAPEVLGALVDPGGDVEGLTTLLEPFGSAALNALLDLVSEEEDQARRAHIVGTAAGLAEASDVPQLAERLRDERWYVVRNVATILGRVGSPAAVPELVPLLRHSEPAVRREAVRSLVSCAGNDAVTYVRRVVDDPDPSVRRAAFGALGGMRSEAAARVLAEVARGASDHGDQQRAIELLGAHPSGVALDLLRELASRRSRPRLPRSLRKTARAAARRAERTA